MRRILVADIFGKTPALEELARAVGGEAEIIDPYMGNFLDFTYESEAYVHFMKHVGLVEYSDVLKETLKSVSTPVELVGFSVGASAAWMISDGLSSEFITRAVCFYGSQIRRWRHIDPSVEVELVLPAFEPGFDVDELARNVSGKARVRVHKTRYPHGFMNRRSRNFNLAGYEYYVDWLGQTPSAAVIW